MKQRNKMSQTCSPTENQPESEFHVFGLPWPEINDGLSYNDVVPRSDSELTLIEFYSGKYKDSAPLQGWLQRIENGQITIDGGIVKDPDSILRAGSELVYHRLPWKEPDAPYLIGVLYEDDDMIALNKPSGLQVLPGGLFQQRTVLTQLQWRTGKQSSSLPTQEPHAVPVHRLGRGTSGILLCAKMKLAKTRLAAYFAEKTSNIGTSSDTNRRVGTRKISKTYRALVNGILDKDKVTHMTASFFWGNITVLYDHDPCTRKVIINQPIGIMRYPGVAKGLYVASSSGKPALSNVDVLERDKERNCTLVQVEIQSGRPHQIRIHLSFIGHPLSGDPLYVAGGQPKCFDAEFADKSIAQDGGYQRPIKPVPGDCGYYLHAHKVALSHPTTNEELSITAPLPSILHTKKEATET
ncbi:PseudoU_synth_2 domain-containing protein [Cephalotus follicularis]|uniref:PseudoU_synth_2 domain-containing protein n=1 Tax=Cephalotus follicularis TaxID=3775 RepID=A0A1Q3BIJ5_CEPFO|nr:PseudoU_synth_2 domain-containing protein [Cephalotus follicularis]